MINPKQSFLLLFRFASIALTVTSCYKPPYHPLPGHNPERKIQYELFTESDDLSQDKHTILFSVFVEKADGRAIWDSSLTPIKTNEIPHLPNKLVVQKIISDTGLLRVGFKYTIVDIGFSGLVDTLHANSTFKIVALNFR